MYEQFDLHHWMLLIMCSTFTRVQRLTCALCLLLTTMLANLMFYGIPTADPNGQVSVFYTFVLFIDNNGQFYEI